MAGLFRIKSSPGLEKKIERLVRERLARRKTTIPAYKTLVKYAEIRKRPPTLPLGQYVRYLILRRQFQGQFSFGFPFAVKVARALHRRFPLARRILDELR